VLLRWVGTALHIENFLLSCRVFSRNIERASLTAVLRYARGNAATEVLGRYRPTAKNTKVRHFYPLNGFIEQAPDGTDLIFRHDLADIGAPPPHVRLTGGLKEACE